MKKYCRTETVMTYDQWKRLYRKNIKKMIRDTVTSVSYTHLRAHETGRNLVCRLLLEKKKKKKKYNNI